MKKIHTVMMLVGTLYLFITACSNETDSNQSNNANVDPTTYDITRLLTHFNGTGLSYQISGNTVIFTTQDLPNHKSPYYLGTQWESSLYETYNGTNNAFALNPNKISTQNITFTIPLYPSEAAVKESTALGAMGIARNGVVFYNQYAGPNNQPLTSEINSFDQFLGHPQQQGAYHYHQEPIFLTQQFGESAFMGLLADGFPVYGPIENGMAVTNGDLDAYHGHFGPTADYPEGIYHYHITSEDPYINGNGFYGTPGSITN